MLHRNKAHNNKYTYVLYNYIQKSKDKDTI